MRRLLLILAILAALTPAAVEAGKPHHPSPPRAGRKAVPRTTRPPVIVYDTVSGCATDSVTVSGFEKAQKASRESMMITNGCSRACSATGIEITYKDMQGRMLHKAVREVAEVIPPGETRMVSVPSFDRQNLFYYHLSPRQARAAQATPFDVEVRVIYLCYPKLSEQ